MKLAILLSLLLLACGRATVGRDPRISAYIENFETYSGVQFNGTVEIVKLNIDTHTIDGMCSLQRSRLTKELEVNSRTSRIQLDSDTYNKAIKAGDSLLLEQILMHEFLHCTKVKDHDPAMTQSKSNYLMPKSVMYPYSFGNTAAYKNNREYYFKELLK